MHKQPDYILEIIKLLCSENIQAQKEGFGPFAAAICNQDGKIITLKHNSVLVDYSSLCHAEINAIKDAQKILNTYDLSKYNLSICITAEPCSMCVGAIMWSGIKSIYYGASSKIVEEITGFDEGYKPNWEEYLSSKGISVTGNIETEICTDLLKGYVQENRKIYKPE